VKEKHTPSQAYVFAGFDVKEFTSFIFQNTDIQLRKAEKQTYILPIA